MSTLVRITGWALLAIGAAVFAVRLHHEGPYPFPRAGNLRAALLALLLGGFLVRDGIAGHALAKPLRWAALAASPIVFLFGLYSTLAELEEVVVLKAADRAGRVLELRLWVADHEGAEWVLMKGAKADAFGLRSGRRAQLMRGGEPHCVVVTRHDDRETVNEIQRVRNAKYAVQRAATAVGFFGRDAKPEIVAVRLDPCPAAGD